MSLRMGGAVLAVLVFASIFLANLAFGQTAPLAPSQGCIGAANSQPLPGTSYSATNFNGCINNAIGLAVIGILVSFAAIAGAYLIGEVFEMGGLKGWYKTEIWEVTKTILLVAIIFPSYRYWAP